MKGWVLGLALAGMLEGIQLDLDCGRRTAARNLIGQAMLSEIEWAEDVNRAAMWEAFGRCAAGAGAEACRDGHRVRFGAELEHQKAAIEAKYRQMLNDFEERCRASIAWVRPPSFTLRARPERARDAPG